MKRYIYILLALLIFAGCAEDSIVPDVDFENLYAITDDPNDPVRHKTYEIFKKYNVPVFFNDTIGMAKSGVDFSGKPVYKYETIDLSWNFSSYDKAKYSFVFVSDEEQKMKSLNVIESYLEIVNSALRPFCFLVVESAKRVDNSTGAITEVSDGTFRIYFRTVLLTGDFEGETYLGIPEALKRELILSKINNLAEDLAYFNAVSDPEWYGAKYWHVIDSSIKQYWDSGVLYDDWSGAKWYTEEELKVLRADARKIVGKFGFVKGSNTFLTGLGTPYDFSNDLLNYVEEMLKYNKQEFEELWGESHLVMKKYGILYEIIKNKLGVEL